MREALGRSYNRLLQATVTPGIVDTQCGAKFAATELWHQIIAECHENGYAWDAEVIAVARALMIPVREVPIEWRHDDRSKVNVFRDGSVMVAATGRIWRNVQRVKQERLQRSAATTTLDLHGEEGVFDETNAKLLSESDVDHWWFRAKSAFVATALRRTDQSHSRTGWLVDGGAGAGGVSVQLGWDPDRLAIVEGNQFLARQAGILHALLAAQGNVDQLPFADSSIDVVCLLDVIEHIPDTTAALAEARRVLTRSGRLVINVPAHQWLWSAADEALGHQRRYTRATLKAELTAAGFQPEISTHVFSWLVAPVWLTRRKDSSGAELGLDRSSPMIELAAIVLTRLERALIGRVSIPFGTSVLSVARPTG
jgi:SAM-dependent methyltransferase